MNNLFDEAYRPGAYRGRHYSDTRPRSQSQSGNFTRSNTRQGPQASMPGSGRCSSHTGPPPGAQARQAQDYYAVLEINRSATVEEVRKAYRAMAMRYHPDKNGNDVDAAERFKLVGEAYEVLNDPVKRNSCDKAQSRASEGRAGDGFMAERAEGAWGGERSQSYMPGDDPDTSGFRGGASPRRGGFGFGSERREETYGHSDFAADLVPFLGYCEVCRLGGCERAHRWFTREGFVSEMAEAGYESNIPNAVLQEFGHRTETQREGFCELCGQGNCRNPHRLYTREGFMWFLLCQFGDQSGASVQRAYAQMVGMYGAPGTPINGVGGRSFYGSAPEEPHAGRGRANTGDFSRGAPNFSRPHPSRYDSEAEGSWGSSSGRYNESRYEEEPRRTPRYDDDYHQSRSSSTSRSYETHYEEEPRRAPHSKRNQSFSSPYSSRFETRDIPRGPPQQPQRSQTFNAPHTSRFQEGVPNKSTRGGFDGQGSNGGYGGRQEGAAPPPGFYRQQAFVGPLEFAAAFAQAQPSFDPRAGHGGQGGFNDLFGAANPEEARGRSGRNEGGSRSGTVGSSSRSGSRRPSTASRFANEVMFGPFAGSRSASEGGRQRRGSRREEGEQEYDVKCVQM